MLLYKRKSPLSYYRSQRRLTSSTSRIIPKENLSAAAYKPKVVERNKYEDWEKSGLFTASNSSENAFSMVLPPPNVTGKLHLGHALTCTIQDVIVRRKRSSGYNVLWLPGTDHAGIATQGVVEKYLKSTQNTDRHTIGREKFNKEVWKWKEKHGNTICSQLRTLGCSLDWTREAFTMSTKHTHAVNTAFIQLFKKGLIYRKKALVNWCVSLKSTVSDIEVENIKLNGQTELKLPGLAKPVKFGLIYNFAYKIYDSNDEIVVSTTMPETMLGDTGIAVHPDDTRYKNFVGKTAVHPFNNRKLQIIADDFVDMTFGTGVVKITPAHSKVDYEVAKKHGLPLVEVVDEDGLIKNAEKFDKLPRYDCRTILIEKLDDLGLLKSVSPHQMSLPTCSRTGDVIQHLPKEQWFLSCSKLNEEAAQAVKDDKLQIEPDKYVKNWLNWTGDNRDWCISRQLWWGHQIPAYKCREGQDVIWIAANDETEAKIEAAKILRTVPDNISLERDTDVLDTWFSSGIYPFAALGWPDDLDRDFYPLSLMVTGHDILGFWVHRMIILGLELTNRLPFNNVLLHGVICDNKGAKMSKSKGNVIDPIDIINGITLDKLKEKTEHARKSGIINKEEFDKAVAYHKANFSSTNGIPECGVDALRFTLLSQDVQSDFVNFDVSMCHANKLFCNKIWQSVKYTQLSFDKLKPTKEEITRKDLTNFDKWILSKLAKMVKRVNESIDNNDFHLTTKSLRTLIYNEFCDVYLEATKSGFESEDFRIAYAHAHTLSAVLHTSLRCLSPFMIYLTDELIPKIPSFDTNVICNYDDTKYFDFPDYKDFKVWNDETENKVEKVLDVIYLIREIKGIYGLSNKLRPSVFIKTSDKNLMDNIKDNHKISTLLSRSEDIQFTNDNNNASNKYITGLLDKNTEISIKLTGDDVENTILTARNKLKNKIQKLEETLNKLETKYSSSKYLNSVPDWVQIKDKKLLTAKREELEKLQRLI